MILLWTFVPRLELKKSKIILGTSSLRIATVVIVLVMGPNLIAGRCWVGRECWIVTQNYRLLLPPIARDELHYA